MKKLGEMLVEYLFAKVFTAIISLIVILALGALFIFSGAFINKSLEKRAEQAAKTFIEEVLK